MATVQTFDFKIILYHLLGL